jgi:iron complex transport system ATP-binding protein
MVRFETERYTVGYYNRPIVRDVSVRLEKGQILTLIGSNGSGKSAILKGVTRHIKKIAGEARIDGKPSDTLTDGDFAKVVSVVLTQRLKTERMTCFDVAAMGRYPYTGLLGVLSDEDKRQVRNALEMVRAWDLRERDFSEVSDGQRQRVNLARTICQQPDIMVLDEPASYLDIRCALDLLQTLRALADSQGFTIILSLHELSYARKVSDLVLCVKDGRITHRGAPEDVFRREIIAELYDLQTGDGLADWFLADYP